MFKTPESPNKQMKRGLAESFTLTGRSFAYRVSLCIHDIAFEFHVSDEEIVRALYDNYPLSWFRAGADPVHVHWVDSRTLGYNDDEWENEQSYDCDVFTSNGKNIALQRDFLGILEGQNCALICPYIIADGFYNFLRWIAPLRFLAQDKILLHSSCVLDADKNAYFALGPSGAGKSTIASLLPRKRVLGDDMNVLKIENGRCWAQAGALGQAITNPSEYSQWYPVKAFLWLKQGPELQLRPEQAAAGARLLMTSVANVFWPTLNERQNLQILGMIAAVSRAVPLFELSFPVHRDVWPSVFQQIRSQV